MTKRSAWIAGAAVAVVTVSVVFWVQIVRSARDLLRNAGRTPRGPATPAEIAA